MTSALNRLNGTRRDRVKRGPTNTVAEYAGARQFIASSESETL
jgi:hypothetical protein